MIRFSAETTAYSKHDIIRGTLFLHQQRWMYLVSDGNVRGVADIYAKREFDKVF